MTENRYECPECHEDVTDAVVAAAAIADDRALIMRTFPGAGGSNKRSAKPKLVIVSCSLGHAARYEIVD